MVSAAAYLLVVCEGAFAVAVGIGVYLRWSDWERIGAEEAARTHERIELARELHDMVGHYVTGMVVQAQAARHVAERQPAAAVAALANIERAGDDAMVATRRMVGGLRHDSPTARVCTWDDVDQLIASAVAQGAPVSATIDPAVHASAPALAPSRGDVLVSPSITVRLFAHFSAATPATEAVFPTAPLTSREEEVLRAAARGRSNTEIAQELFLSLGTVKTHLSNLQAKVGARNRVELAAFAWQSGRMRK